MAEPGILEMVKQARELQKKMSKVQKRIAKTEITANAGGGMVTAVVNGNLEVKRVVIEPDLVRSGDVRMIQDLVRAALNAAIKKAQDLMAEEMKQVTGGLHIPGLF
ncbi:MAG: YbaB/EbfC family nucleoid-associated protein [Candidatus Dadabacteria bacterium]|nr:MAG: YbaB/EbfC family nucleoid-associated protein [Candidatus Dadabacteria bacterium]